MVLALGCRSWRSAVSAGEGVGSAEAGRAAGPAGVSGARAASQRPGAHAADAAEGLHSPQKLSSGRSSASEMCVLQEKDRLTAMERSYSSLSGGKSFSRSSSALREVSEAAPSLLTNPLTSAGLHWSFSVDILSTIVALPVFSLSMEELKSYSMKKSVLKGSNIISVQKPRLSQLHPLFRPLGCIFPKFIKHAHFSSSPLSNSRLRLLNNSL